MTLAEFVSTGPGLLLISLTVPAIAFAVYFAAQQSRQSAVRMRRINRVQQTPGPDGSAAKAVVSLKRITKDSGIGAIDAIEPVSLVTLVVNQELPTVRRAAQVATLLRQRYGKDRVVAVVSRYETRAEIRQDDIERVVGAPVWAVMPSDYRRAVAAANAGQPLVRSGQSRLSTAAVEFAKKLAGLGSRKVLGRTTAKAGRLGGLF